METQVTAVQEATNDPPNLPSDCRQDDVKSGAAIGDRADVAWLKAERALSQQNARVGRCAKWHDDSFSKK